MSDHSRASRRRALAAFGGLAALAAAPRALAVPPASALGARFEALDLRGPPPAPLAAALEPLRAKAVLVNFWASWCEPCRVEMPGLVALDAGEAAIGLVTVAVADRLSDVLRFFEEQRVAPAVVHDPDQAIARAWDVSLLPTTLLLDAAHRPRYRVRGELDWNAADVRERVRTLAAEAPPRN